MKTNVVLVRTEYAANIGASARAMANMGADRLILVDPHCKITVKAREMAAGAQSQLKSALIYESWDDFYASEPDGLRLGLTRRGGRNRKVFPLIEKLSELRAASRTEDLYLIFGPEADGLNSDDLRNVNFMVHLPVFGEFGSLNLAQAVLLALYLTRENFPPERRATQAKGAPNEPVQPFYLPDDLIKRWLMAMGFDVKARRSSAYLTLRRLFLQNQPTRHEVQVLEAILQQNIRKLEAAGSVNLAAENAADDLGDIAVKNIDLL